MRELTTEELQEIAGAGPENCTDPTNVCCLGSGHTGPVPCQEF